MLGASFNVGRKPVGSSWTGRSPQRGVAVGHGSRGYELIVPLNC